VVVCGKLLGGGAVRVAVELGCGWGRDRIGFVVVFVVVFKL
jgi:hypothetical protein